MLDLLETQDAAPRAELLATSTELDEWLRAGLDDVCGGADVDALMEAIERCDCAARFVPDGFGPASIDAA